MNPVLNQVSYSQNSNYVIWPLIIVLYYWRNFLKKNFQNFQYFFDHVTFWKYQFQSLIRFNETADLFQFRATQSRDRKSLKFDSCSIKLYVIWPHFTLQGGVILQGCQITLFCIFEQQCVIRHGCNTKPYLKTN